MPKQSFGSPISLPSSKTRVTSAKSWSFLNTPNAEMRVSQKSFHLRQSFSEFCILCLSEMQGTHCDCPFLGLAHPFIVLLTLGRCKILELELFETSSDNSHFRSIHNSFAHPIMVIFYEKSLFENKPPGKRLHPHPPRTIIAQIKGPLPDGPSL